MLLVEAALRGDELGGPDRVGDQIAAEQRQLRRVISQFPADDAEVEITVAGRQETGGTVPRQRNRRCRNVRSGKPGGFDFEIGEIGVEIGRLPDVKPFPQRIQCDADGGSSGIVAVEGCRSDCWIEVVCGIGKEAAVGFGEPGELRAALRVVRLPRRGRGRVGDGQLPVAAESPGNPVLRSGERDRILSRRQRRAGKLRPHALFHFKPRAASVEDKAQRETVDLIEQRQGDLRCLAVLQLETAAADQVELQHLIAGGIPDQQEVAVEQQPGVAQSGQIVQRDGQGAAVVTECRNRNRLIARREIFRFGGLMAEQFGGRRREQAERQQQCGEGKQRFHARSPSG